MLSVKDLYAYFKKEIKAGHGDYSVFVTDDEEANGYHALFYIGATKQEIVQDEGLDTYNRLYRDANCDLFANEKDRDNVIYIG